MQLEGKNANRGLKMLLESKKCKYRAENVIRGQKLNLFRGRSISHPIHMCLYCDSCVEMELICFI